VTARGGRCLPRSSGAPLQPTASAHAAARHGGIPLHGHAAEGIGINGLGHTASVGKLVITMPAVSYARELWRFGERELAYRAASMDARECADVGERAGELSLSGEAPGLWPGGPSGHASAILLAVIEHLEGRARPCSRSRRAPAKSLPPEWQLSESQRWAAVESVAREMDSRLHR